MGVNYPPLSHLWLRLTDGVHGQLAAVAVGLLVLLPWAVRSVARALRVEVSPGVWGVLFSLLAVAANTHWLLPGFHSMPTGFGSWPAMIAALLGVVCVARAFDLARPVSTGVLVGVSVLFNSTVAPGVVVLVLAVLVGALAEGRRPADVLRWAGVVSLVGVAVCGWWLVPFVHGWGRLVEWRVPLAAAVRASSGQVLFVVVLTVVLAAAVSRLGRRGRVAAAGALAAAAAAGVGDWLGYLRAERWITPAAALAMVLCALGAARLIPAGGLQNRQAGLSRLSESPPTGPAETLPPAAGRAAANPPPNPDGAPAEDPLPAEGLTRGGGSVSPAQDTPTGPRPTNRRTGPGSGLRRRRLPGRYAVAAVGVLAGVLMGLWAAVPLAVWLLWRRRWAFVRYGAPAWVALLAVVPAGSLFAPPEDTGPAPSAAMTLTRRADENNVGGFVYLQESFEHARGGVGNCGWGDPWALVASTDTKLRPLTGLYRETGASSEFIAVAETSRQGAAQVYGEPMDQWAPAWDAAPAGTPINHQTAAGALGASWYVFCDSTDTITARRLVERRASGVALAPHATNDAWHRDAVGWWAGLLTGEYALQDAEAAVPTHGEVDWGAYPPAQAAGGVSVLEAGESFAVTAQTAGWVWIRVPWDPYWHSHNNTPVLKGGPGHIVAWADEGHNNYGWWVPPQVDTAAIITTAGAAALAITLLITGRRRPQSPDLPSRRPTGRQSDKI